MTFEPTFALGLALSGLMGVVLGALGGGGSILTLPILVYVIGVGTKEAIAISLFVVATTSLVGVVQHARAGNVRWGTGALFGASAMLGAYGGGRLAAYVPASVLLAGFTALMLATGVALLTRRRSNVERKVRPSYGLVLVEGLVVGAVTGMVGAGGGFLVVPALLLLGGLSMTTAVGTSLLVIALKSFAGFAGHLGHVTVDWSLTLPVTLIAIVGVLFGGHVATRVAPERLRKAFATLVLGMGLVMGASQLPESVRRFAFVDRWPFWVSGIVLGVFAVVFLLVTRRALGVSTGYSDTCNVVLGRGSKTWRLPFLLGIVGGGVVASMLGGVTAPSFAVAAFDDLVSLSAFGKAVVFGAGGLLIGFGTRLAGGCTSGHGIVGMAQLARSSILATATFMLTGFVATNALVGLFGG